MTVSSGALCRKGFAKGRRMATRLSLSRGDKQKEKSGWRNEWKCFLTVEDYFKIQSRLQKIADIDPHAKSSGGAYRIRSLYFDDWNDSALTEKLDGLDAREKFRIRLYNGNLDTLHLEKKCRMGGRGRKYSEDLTDNQVQSLLAGNLEWMEKISEEAFEQKSPNSSIVLELYYKMQYYGLHPCEVVEYIREPYIYDPGNVRVTFDYNLRRSMNPWDLLCGDAVLPFPTEGIPWLMEVKWDQFLPSIIQEAVQFPGPFLSFSKYAHCRLTY